MRNKGSKICVVGSSMIDQIARAPRLPGPGETLVGTSYKIGFGGKGANQAVAAARLGADVTMVVKLGRDVFGEQTRQNFADQGIATDFLFFDDDQPSGVAPIWVDEETGQNSIIVVPGANNTMTREEVRQAAPAIEAAELCIAQLEIPIPCNIEAFTIARAAGSTTILNPAPAAELPAELLELTDILVPNEPEAELLTGIAVKDRDSAAKAARALQERGVKTVVITLGAQGAYALRPDGTEILVEAPPVKAVDTTGAGDCFIGSFSYFLAQGQGMEPAMRRACVVAAKSVTRHGTQTSFPTCGDLPELFEE